MLFNSYEFLFLFLPSVIFVYFSLNRWKLFTLSKTWLLVASLFFYAYWKIEYLPLLILSELVNYSLGRTIVVSRHRPILRRAMFVIGLSFDIGLLMYFKYLNFFVDNLNLVAGAQVSHLNIILPLGISFYTLQQIAYLVDVYQGAAKDIHFLDYFAFVTFFSHLIAGPIVLHKQFVPQLNDPDRKRFNPRNFAMGLFILMIGLAKKLLIADSIAPLVDYGFDQANQLSLLEGWFCSVGYMMQLYFDFSGYSDVAIGAGLMLNIQIPQNFNTPFSSRDMIEFWQRWHVTLSNFITTYLYTPLIRAWGKVTFAKAMIATLVSMTIAGVWHGAAWTFVIFGVLHGIGIVANHMWRKTNIKMPTWLAMTITFLYINSTFVFFRAKEMGDAFKVFRGMSQIGGIFKTPMPIAKELNLQFTKFGYKYDVMLALLLALITYSAIRGKNSLEITAGLVPTWKMALGLGVICALVIVGINRKSSFLYFNF